MTDAVSPLAPFEGSYSVPGFELTRRWFDARDLTPELRDEVIAVIRESFNNQASWFALPVTAEDHFDWKFRDRPSGSTMHLTADREGRVVGFTGGVRRIWLIKGRPYVSRGGHDLSLLPEWQGRGVQRVCRPFSKREWHPSEDLGLGYVNHPANRRLAIEDGNQAPANETHDYVRLLRPFEQLRFPLRGAGTGRSRSASSPLSNTNSVIRERNRRRADDLRMLAHRSVRFAASLLARRPAARRAPWTISTITRFEQEHESFITEALGQFEFVADRSIPYLNWRFCDERAGPFTVRLAQQDGKFLGYAVTRVLNKRAHLADILVLPGQPAVAEALVRDAVDLAKTAGADSIHTRLPKRHPYRSALVRTGFFDVGHVAGELVAARHMPAADLAFLDREDARIHSVLADSDF